MEDRIVTMIREIPISHIIGHYLTLEKKGNNYVALCPFHSDTKPSLSISDRLGMFKCFVDNSGGDAITFVQQYCKCNFVDALKEICKIMNIPFDSSNKESPKSQKEIIAKELLLNATKIYQDAAKIIHSLEFNTFLDARKISIETAEKFQIGIAPNSSEITKFIEEIKDDSEYQLHRDTAIELELIKHDKETFDRFRYRVMFPIKNDAGVICGFSGRAIRDGKVSKYINSSASFFFQKRDILFGYNFAKNEIREKSSAIIVEGHIDVIALHNHGFINSVGLMGVTLSQERLKTLLPQTNTIYLGLDNDEAGFKATIKINNQFLLHGMIPKFISYHPFKDADEFLQNNPPEKLQELIDNAPDFIDILIDQALTDSQNILPSKKFSTLKEIFTLLSPLGTMIEATERICQVALSLEFALSPEQVIEYYKDYLDEIAT